jgi:hypothetical protein
MHQPLKDSEPRRATKRCHSLLIEEITLHRASHNCTRTMPRTPLESQNITGIHKRLARTQTRDSVDPSYDSETSTVGDHFCRGSDRVAQHVLATIFLAFRFVLTRPLFHTSGSLGPRYATAAHRPPTPPRHPQSRALSLIDCNLGRKCNCKSWWRVQSRSTKSYWRGVVGMWIILGYVASRHILSFEPLQILQINMEASTWDRVRIRLAGWIVEGFARRSPTRELPAARHVWIV